MIEYIELNGVDFCVYFDYTPKETATWDHPGCSEEIEITGLSLQNYAAIDLLLFTNDQTIKELEVRCLKRLKAHERQRLEDIAETLHYDRMAA